MTKSKLGAIEYEKQRSDRAWTSTLIIGHTLTYWIELLDARQIWHLSLSRDFSTSLMHFDILQVLWIPDKLDLADNSTRENSSTCEHEIE